MSPQELAEAINAYVWKHYDRLVNLDRSYISKLELGKHHWPNAQYRAALRSILPAPDDASLGFYPRQRSQPQRPSGDHHGAEHEERTGSVASAAGNSSKALRAAERTIESIDLSDSPWTPDRIHELAGFIASGGELGPQTAREVSQAWRTTQPPQILELRSGRRIGQRLADLVIERTETLRRMDDFLGGADMHDLVRQELTTTLTMIDDASYTEPIGRQILASVGELAQLAGWVADDAGLRQQAERYYLAGVSAAHAARDEPLAANLLSTLSYQYANIGDPREAVLLATTAANGVPPHTTGTTRALLMERVAWANARLGDARATERALGAVDDLFTETKYAEPEPNFTYWLTRDEIAVMAGRCYVQLQRPEPAITLLTGAVDRYDDSHQRETSLYLSYLAEAHLQAKDVEASVTVALRALEAAMGVASARSSGRINHLLHLLAPSKTNERVREFSEALLASRPHAWPT
ncbi:hypothetical protein [Kineosporia babensis]|uniref:Transcriptional regulator n=1 Tax=Kineosporia babensis TaxID=499548 RepID=A0A9X1NMF7_9ACTN|nr:hypothetical protein [Kineosporia babensis]MCD5316838.1 hypothetical protein [Kineosporia babensis]